MEMLDSDFKKVNKFISLYSKCIARDKRQDIEDARQMSWVHYLENKEKCDLNHGGVKGLIRRMCVTAISRSTRRQEHKRHVFVGNALTYMEETAYEQSWTLHHTMKRVVNNQLNHLNPLEKSVIKLKYGIGYVGPLYNREIGERLNIKVSHVQDLYVSAIKKLRQDKSIKQLERSL